MGCVELLSYKDMKSYEVKYVESGAGGRGRNSRLHTQDSRVTPLEAGVWIYTLADAQVLTGKIWYCPPPSEGLGNGWEVKFLPPSPARSS
ncbi:hypothetical protein AGIG_G6566 [Arapaima gigas]